MAEIVRRRSWGGVLPLGRHASISGSSLIHCAFVSIAPSLFQERQNARIQKRFKLEQALANLRSELRDPEGRFRLVYLIDDFAGTGTSFLRYDEEKAKWKGKLIRFRESVE